MRTKAGSAERTGEVEISSGRETEEEVSRAGEVRPQDRGHGKARDVLESDAPSATGMPFRGRRAVTRGRRTRASASEAQHLVGTV